MALATKKGIEDFLEENPVWKRDGEAIKAEFKFKDFSEAMGFVTRVALAAEKADHHPDIDIRWNKVTLVLSTHSEGGITKKDLDLALMASSWG
jgi:4a-hydroxytetrahydrobiopterin dehydratase